MSDKLQEDVKKIVDDIFKTEEEAKMRKQAQDALEKSANTINELNDSLEAKDVELVSTKEQIAKLEETVAGLELKIEELTKTKEDLEAEKAAFDTEKEELAKKVADAETALDNIKKDQLAATRFTELESAGVASKNKETQIAKVREMSDEEFAAYKEELVSIKESIMADIERSAATKAADGVDSATVADDNAVKADADVDGVGDDAPVFTPSQAAMAALNLEARPSDDMMQKYAALGQAMAESYKKE